MPRVLCYPHARTILPIYMDRYRDYDRIEYEDGHPPICICGAPWSYAAVEAQRRDIPDTDDRGKLNEYYSRFMSEGTSGDGEQTPEPRWYFGTFTQPPDINDNDPSRILKATQKVMKSKMVDAISWCYSLELMKNGSPHTHFAVYTKKYPNKHKIFKFNISDKGALYRSDWEREKYDVKKYIQKPVTKPDAIYCDKWGLKDTVVFSPEFPTELMSNTIV